MFRNRYQRHEVGAGWIDPHALGSRLRGGIRLLTGNESTFQSWVAAIGLSLCVLSWWHGLPVHEVVLWIIACFQNLLG